MGDVAQRKMSKDLEIIEDLTKIVCKTLDGNSILRAELSGIMNDLDGKIQQRKIDLAPKIREYEGLRLKTLELENTRNKLVIEINELLTRSGLNENTVFEKEVKGLLYPHEGNIMHLREVVVRLRARFLALKDAYDSRLFPDV